MAYIDNKTIIVDAQLTKKGRQLLAANGSLKITSFALADDEIDYSLYNDSLGSTNADIAIINTPVLQPNSDETQVMKYKLVTLDPGSTFIPTVTVDRAAISINKGSNAITITPSTNPSTYNSSLGYTAILGNSKVGTITVRVPAPNSTTATTATVATFAGDVSAGSSQSAVGLEFLFTPSNTLTQTTVTSLTIIGNESGGGVSIPVTVIIP